MGTFGPGEQQTAIACISMSSIHLFLRFYFYPYSQFECVQKCSFARVRTKPLPLE